MKKEAVDSKESTEECMGGLGGGREQAYYSNYIVISLKRAITYKMLKVICCIIIKRSFVLSCEAASVFKTQTASHPGLRCVTEEVTRLGCFVET